MDIQEAIEHTKGYKGMMVSITGIASRIQTSRGSVPKGRKSMMGEFAKHFEQARKAWLSGDLETVADFFSIYV